MSSAIPRHREWGYLVMWEFKVRAGMQKRFEKAYGPGGDWARFFSKDASYITTELVRQLKAARTYVTLDFWTSQEAYDAFRKQHFARYEALDQKCEGLTQREREIGRFKRVSSE
jgi:heme-degrading monooxygenase HmoA